MQHFTLYFQSGAVIEMLEKNQRNAADFLGVRFSITPIQF